MPFDWDDAEPAAPPDAPHLSVEITEPDVVGYLYGPDGAPFATILDRPWVPFGFQRSGR